MLVFPLPSFLKHCGAIIRRRRLLPSDAPSLYDQIQLSLFRRRDGRSETISHLMITLLTERALRLNQIGL